MKHGDGGKWYLNARNYTKELADEQRAVEHLEAVYKKFEQTWSGKTKGLNIPGLDYKLKMPIIGRVIKYMTHRLFYNENPNRQDTFVDGHFGQVLPMEEAKMILGGLAQEPILQSYCACRWAFRGNKDAKCINFGPISHVIEKLPRYAPGKEKMRIDREQAIESIEQFNSDGNILSVYFHPVPTVSTICACDTRDCAGFAGRRNLDLYALFKGEYVASLNPDNCEACKDCISRCQLGSITYSGTRKHVVIDTDTCFGCGLCRDACEFDAISLIPRDEVPGLKGQY
jgi:NAD-dependent dihydropyrimidine dehydrogenase PreA subunit